MKIWGTRWNCTKAMLHKNGTAMVPSLEITRLTVQGSYAGFMSDECH